MQSIAYHRICLVNRKTAIITKMTLNIGISSKLEAGEYVGYPFLVILLSSVVLRHMFYLGQEAGEKQARSGREASEKRARTLTKFDRGTVYFRHMGVLVSRNCTIFYGESVLEIVASFTVITYVWNMYKLIYLVQSAIH
jgi:hypothetical protein